MAQAAAQQMLHAQLAAQGYRFASPSHQPGSAEDAGAAQSIIAAQAQAQAAQFLMQMSGATTSTAGVNAQIQSLLHTQQLFQQQALFMHQQQSQQQQLPSPSSQLIEGKVDVGALPSQSGPPVRTPESQMVEGATAVVTEEGVTTKSNKDGSSGAVPFSQGTTEGPNGSLGP